MSRVKWAVAAAAGMTLVAGVGCYSPPQYAPQYGYPAAPAYPTAPGGSYIVPGGSSPGMMGTPSPYPSGSSPTLAPPSGTGSDAPPFTFDRSSPTPAGPAVPEYSDPAPSDFGGSGSFGTPPSAGGGVGAPPEDGFQPPTGESSPFMEGTAAPRPLGFEQASTTSPDYFAGLDRYRRSDRPTAPVPLAASTTGVQPAAFEERPVPNDDFGFDPVTSPEAPNANAQSGADEGFAYDSTSYRWLRGVIDYDDAARNWNVIYGLNPEAADRFGGSLTLIDGGRLAEFRDNDVVFLEGKIDQSAGRDALGKPYYRVTRAELIGRYE